MLGNKGGVKFSGIQLGGQNVSVKNPERKNAPGFGETLQK